MIDIKEVEEVRTGVHMVIDYFTATFPFICYEDDFELKIIDEVVEMVYRFLGYKKEDVLKENYAQNNFHYQYLIGDYIVLRLVGPILKSEHHSCSLEMKGQACRDFENVSNKSWYELLEFFMIRLNAKPTRIDIAIDDYEGKEIDINYLINKLDKKYYTTNFKKKYYKLYGCDEEGWSIQFGNYSSTQMLVIYEKNKEQLAKGNICLQKYWLRFEMRFFHDKAYNVAFSLLDKELKSFSFGLLRELLDIKKDNNYDEENQYKVKSDIRWLAFIDNQEKVKMEKYQVKDDSFLNYYKWLAPHAASFFLINLLVTNQYASITKLYKNLLSIFETIDNKKLKRFNKFRKQNGLSPIDFDYIFQLEKEIKAIIEERNLPF